MADATIRVGAVQAEPVWLDLQGSVNKTISLIEEAATDGVQVLGFPEVWIPGYPVSKFHGLFCSYESRLSVKVLVP